MMEDAGDELKPFDGRLVEIQAAAGDGAPGGPDPRARQGRARWDAETGGYLVQTFDGELVDVPAAADLRELETLSPEEGGFDLAWPTDSETYGTFGFVVAESLLAKGYCLIQMFVPTEMGRSAVDAAKALEGYSLPKEEFEQAFLGYEHDSKVQWFDGSMVDSEALATFGDQLRDLNHMLTPVISDFMDFRPSGTPGSVMIRVPLASPYERQAVSPGPLSEDDLKDGLIAQHLDFVQRRRLCAMYMLHDGGTVELQPQEGLGWLGVRLPSTKGKLLVFRHDYMSYAYRPQRFDDLVLQTWVMEEPPALKLETFEGDQRGMELILDSAPPIPPEKQVHIMSAMCNFPSAGYHSPRAWIGYAWMNDGFTEIPTGRWDMSLYWSDDPNSFGKSVTRHSGLLTDEMLRGFDNKFFGIEDEVAAYLPPLQRLLIENSFEAFAIAGWTLETLRGQPIATCIADIGSDWDAFFGFQEKPEAWLKAATIHSVPSAARLASTLKLTGPVSQVDTACSSSTVSANMLHSLLRQHRIKEINWGLSMGTQNILLPWPFVGLSGAGMLGRSGRCLTFDQSANGYNRSEGVGGLLLKFSGDVTDVRDRLACFVSCYINQDGRSASLTAPNGPSQQACVRGSLREARVAPDDMNITENHGTGTALGDPIEVGSIRAVFAKRPTPLPITTGKSHIGHLESTAGSVGLVKVVATLSHAAVPPNCHLRQLNAHIEIEGFPGQWPTELTDLGVPEVFGGLNSFGFGGTNSRADMWANRLPGNDGTGKLRELKAEHIQRLDSISVLCPRCLGHMDWLSAEATPDVPRKGKLNPSLVRQEGASYEYCSLCYTGAYQFGEVVGRNSPDTGQPVYLVGSWSAWSSFEEMEFVEDGPEGYYVGTIRLGETLLEHFRLVLNKDRSKAIFPVVAKADQRKRVHGPGICGQDKSWLIDGRLDGVPAGTAYQVRFSWSRVRKSVTWAVMEAQPPEPAAAALRHSYSIVSSLNRWQPLEMTQSAEDPGVWEFKSRMQRESEEFLFMRDRDQAQLIYPLSSRAADPSVPVMGPDEGGFLKRWAVPGEVREPVTIQLSVKDGGFTVTASTGSRGSTSWQSPQGRTRHLYYVAGSWDRWGLNEMATDADAPDVHTCRFVMGNRCREEFHILLNQSESLLMYPREPGAAPGQGILCGPDARGGGVNWEVVGPAGQVMEVTLDLGAPDARRAVTCRPCALSD